MHLDNLATKCHRRTGFTAVRPPDGLGARRVVTAAHLRRWQPNVVGTPVQAGRSHAKAHQAQQLRVQVTQLAHAVQHQPRAGPHGFHDP